MIARALPFGLCAVGALTGTSAHVLAYEEVGYDDAKDGDAAVPGDLEAAPVVSRIGGGVTGSASGVQDATGTMDELERIMAGTGVGTGMIEATGTTGATGTEAMRPPSPPLPRQFPDVAFPPASEEIMNVNSTQFCAKAKSCIECTAMVGCGFDSNSLRCEPGTSEGPLHKTSDDPKLQKFRVDNFWQYGSCSDVSCDEYPTCSQCMADSLCGWCAATGVCRYVFSSYLFGLLYLLIFFSSFCYFMFHAFCHKNIILITRISKSLPIWP